MLLLPSAFRRLGCQLAAAAISRIWRPFPCHRTSDGTRTWSQIGRSFLFDLSRLSAKCVPSPSRKSSSASIRHASVLRFVSLALPYLFHGWLGPFTDCSSLERGIHRFFLSPRCVHFAIAGPEGAKNLAGKSPPLIRARFATLSLAKIRAASQANSQQPLIADSSSINAVSFSSARTSKRFPSRCASAIQVVRPSESKADTIPQLHPALLRLSAMVSQYFIR